MLAFDRSGHGEPLVLLHGTNCDRHIWDPLLPQLCQGRDVVNVDLPAHGESAATSFTPPAFARDVAGLLDALGLTAPAVAGHSVGGWTALEMAKLGRAGAVLALMPAGLWRRRSPRATDLGLRFNWRMAQLLGERVDRPLRSRLVRRVGLRGVSARPQDVTYEAALDAARSARASQHFPRHFAETRSIRFAGGEAVDAAVPVRVVWGDRDRIAIAGKSRFPETLPGHATIETWKQCGHMVMWDRPGCVIRAMPTVPG